MPLIIELVHNGDTLNEQASDINPISISEECLTVAKEEGFAPIGERKPNSVTNRNQTNLTGSQGHSKEPSNLTFIVKVLIYTNGAELQLDDFFV